MALRLAALVLATAFLGVPTSALPQDTTLQLFDQHAYDTRVAPAFRAFARSKDPRLLKGLLDATLRELRAHPAPPRFGGDITPLDELTVALEILEGSTRRDDNLVLRRDGKPVSREEAIRSYVERHVFPLLVDVVCLVREEGVRQEINLWNSRLASYLYKRSEWIEEAFRGLQPPVEFHLQFSTCESTETIPPWFVALFLNALRRVPRPSGDAVLEREYDLLLRILTGARERASLRLTVEAC